MSRASYKSTGRTGRVVALVATDRNEQGFDPVNLRHSAS